jgi:hypothetical protein
MNSARGRDTSKKAVHREPTGPTSPDPRPSTQCSRPATSPESGGDQPRPLPKTFTQNSQNLDYTQIERTGNIALYEVRYIGASYLYGYVVAKIQIEPEQKMPSGKILPLREAIPRASKFGQYGWFYMAKSEDIARGHYQQLLEKEFTIKD